MKSVSVYAREPWIVVASSTGLFGGTWYASEPFIRLPLTASDSEFGKALDRALEASQNLSYVPPGLSLSGVDRPILAHFGARSRTAFMEGMRQVMVDINDDDEVIVQPFRNDGPKGGFAWMDDLATHLKQPKRSELITAVRQALEAAVPWTSEIAHKPTA